MTIRPLAPLSASYLPLALVVARAIQVAGAAPTCERAVARGTTGSAANPLSRCR